jgi:hypothetical protein
MVAILATEDQPKKCRFCHAETWFVDADEPYCIDCYCKLRNSAHTHQVVNPQPVVINPLPTTVTRTFIC